MRVLLIAGMYPPGRCGVGDYVASLARALARTPEVQLAVLTQRAAGRTPEAGFQVLEVATNWRPWELPRAVDAIRRFNPEVVHIHWPSLGFGGRLGPALLPLACKFLGARVVQTWHDPWHVDDSARYRLQRIATDGLIFVRQNFMSLMPRQLLRYMPACPQRFIGSAGALPVSTLSAAQRERLRERYLNGRRTLVAFFGFVYPSKGVEQLFEIADPTTDSLLIVGGLLDADYRRRLDEVARARGWIDQFQYMGFVEAQEAADLLHAADAVVLPFLAGGGDWNTSIHGALAQGTFVVTTSAQPEGDDPGRNLYTARISDVADMRRALRLLAGRRIQTSATDPWAEIARLHAAFYGELVRRPSAT